MHPWQQFVRIGGPVVLALLATISCSRPFETPAEGASNESRAPFKTPQTAADPKESVDVSPAALSTARHQTLPFQASQELPAGTLLTVRLQTPIIVKVPIMVDSFEALVEQPVVLEGNTLIPHGASVAGHVESVFISEMEPRRGYVGLALETVHLAGNDVPVRTSSLFARQASAKNSQGATIRLERGRRFTFRLTEPVSIILHPMQASR